MKRILFALLALLAGCGRPVFAQQMMSQAVSAPTTVVVPLNFNGSQINTVQVAATGGASGLAFSFQANSNSGTTDYLTLGSDVCVNQPVATPASGLSGDGHWRCNVSGYANFQVNVTAVGSGTETFKVSGSMANEPNQPTAAVPVATATAVEASHVLTAGPGNFLGVVVTSGATAGYVMIFNATTAPADGTVAPVYWAWLPANQTVSLGGGTGVPPYFSTGIVAVFSSTGPFTKTASATAVFTGLVQ